MVPSVERFSVVSPIKSKKKHGAFAIHGEKYQVENLDGNRNHGRSSKIAECQTMTRLISTNAGIFILHQTTDLMGNPVQKYANRGPRDLKRCTCT